MDLSLKQSLILLSELSTLERNGFYVNWIVYYFDTLEELKK